MKNKPNFDELKAIIEKAKKTDFTDIDKAAHDLVHFFIKIQDRLSSEDDKERAAALQDLETLQKELDAYAAHAVQKSGMTSNELHQYMHNKENFSDEQWERLQAAQKELKDYEHELVRSTKGTKSPQATANKKGTKGIRRPPRSDWLSG